MPVFCTLELSCSLEFVRPTTKSYCKLSKSNAFWKDKDKCWNIYCSLLILILILKEESLMSREYLLDSSEWFGILLATESIRVYDIECELE